MLGRSSHGVTCGASWSASSCTALERARSVYGIKLHKERGHVPHHPSTHHLWRGPKILLHRKVYASSQRGKYQAPQSGRMARRARELIVGSPRIFRGTEGRCGECSKFLGSTTALTTILPFLLSLSFVLVISSHHFTCPCHPSSPPNSLRLTPVALS